MQCNVMCVGEYVCVCMGVGVFQVVLNLSPLHILGFSESLDKTARVFRMLLVSKPFSDFLQASPLVKSLSFGAGA